jgi:hypothetical protein
MKGAYLGPSFTPDEIEAFLEKHGCVVQRSTRDD